MQIRPVFPGPVTFKLSEEGETFLETVFSSKMEYVMRKAKLAKYGQPDSRWTRFSELGSVVEGILSNEALKQDKVSYRFQQLWLEAAGPLVACLEKVHEGNLSLQEAIPMLQSSLMLMGMPRRTSQQCEEKISFTTLILSLKN